MKVVIIGGVAGGATAAARLRRLDENAEIVLLERSGYISYANCGLPYYVGSVIQDREALTLQTPERFRARFNIDVRVRHEAVALHPERRTVTVRRLEDGSWELRFGYTLSGALLELQGSLTAARFLVEEGRICAYTLKLRQYQDTGERTSLLPEAQAAAALSASAGGDRELILRYSDPGGDAQDVGADWAVWA